MYKGKITEIERSKGYGFINSEFFDKIFFHQRWLKKIKLSDLEVGSEVRFCVNQGTRGPRAHNVRPASMIIQQQNEAKIRRIDQLFKD